MSLLKWDDALIDEKKKDYFKNIISKIEADRKSGKIIYPSNAEIFNALKFTELKNVKLVILGQDPYHGPNQAHGLAFSVKKGVKKPPSLNNIFKELHSDLKISIPENGSLESWAKEGVLLLNSVLSVEASKAGSHANYGWQEFTDKIIEIINNNLENVVFLLWGAYAQKKARIVDPKKHHILKAPHPSPLSAHRGFLGCKHFSRANQFLESIGEGKIDWNL
ncbi:UNVERIFIED_CONTAM: hypothetical protein GTU68_039232 [Idotea baltica]|nr:hypothetical protein [Idotea baltica]